MSAGAYEAERAGWLGAASNGIAQTVARADEGLAHALTRLEDRTGADPYLMGAGFRAVAALALLAQDGRRSPSQYLALPLEVIETADALEPPGFDPVTGELVTPGGGMGLVNAMFAAHALPGPLGPRCERFGRTERLVLACLLPAGHPCECHAEPVARLATDLEPFGQVLELEDDGEFEQLVGALSPEGFQSLPDGMTAEELYAHHGVLELLPWARRIAAA